MHTQTHDSIGRCPHMSLRLASKPSSVGRVPVKLLPSSHLRHHEKETRTASLEIIQRIQTLVSKRWLTYISTEPTPIETVPLLGLLAVGSQQTVLEPASCLTPTTKVRSRNKSEIGDWRNQKFSQTIFEPRPTGGPTGQTTTDEGFRPSGTTEI